MSNDINNPNIIFMGTPEFSVPVLDLIHRDFGVKAVVTVPDKPMGRGMKVRYSAVKQAALDRNIPVLQPANLIDSDFINQLAELEPDIIVVIAFRILPPEVYKLAKIGAFNIHSSILPAYRGAAPINRAIINGEKRTGLTTFLLEDKVDTGNILLIDEFDIPDNFTAGDLHDYMMPRAADIGLKTCHLLLSGNYNPIKQDHLLASPAPKLFPEQAWIDWSNRAETVRNFIHGYSPFPGARTMFNEKMIKILRCEIANCHLDPGEYIIDKNAFIVGCKDLSIKINELQLEGKKAVASKQFINGYRGALRGKLG